MPGIGHPCRQPGEDAQYSGDACSDDRRLRTDRDHVGADGGERAKLTRKARDAEEPCQQQRSAGDEGDVLARDGEEVIQPRRAKAFAQLLGEAAVGSEHDPFDHRRALASNALGDAALEAATNPVRNPTKPAASADDAHRLQA